MLCNVCEGKVNKPNDLLHQVSVYPFPFMLIDSRLLFNCALYIVHSCTFTLVVFLLVPSDSFSIIKEVDVPSGCIVFSCLILQDDL